MERNDSGRRLNLLPEVLRQHTRHLVQLVPEQEKRRMFGLAKARIPFMVFAIGAILSRKAGFTAAVARFYYLLPGPTFVQLHQRSCLASAVSHRYRGAERALADRLICVLPVCDDEPSVGLAALRGTRGLKLQFRHLLPATQANRDGTAPARVSTRFEPGLNSLVKGQMARRAIRPRLHLLLHQ